MVFLSRRKSAGAPRNLCELFVRDLALLLTTSAAISHSLLTLRPECERSPGLDDLTRILDRLIATCGSGEACLRRALADAGIDLPGREDAGSGTLVAGFFACLPAQAAPAIFASDLVLNLRLLAHHVGLRARLAAEKAALVGQSGISRTLVNWAGEWQACNRDLRANSLHTHAQAYVADVNEAAAHARFSHEGV